MQIFLSLLLIFYSSISISQCHFKDDIKKVFSFSGATSVALKEMGLLKNSKLKGISVFNPISESDFSGKLFPGGIFLSRDVLREFESGVVFFDESRELSTILRSVKSLRAVEIKTRGLVPENVTKLVLKKLDPFLMGCEKEKTSFILKTESTAKRLLGLIPQNRTANYYLGEFHQGRLPDLLIVQDGVVKWLIDQKKIQSYPSPLAYVNWSAKILRSMPKNTIHIAVKDSGREMKKVLLKGDNNRWSLTYPGSLVPGLSQLEAWIYFEENFSP